MGKNCCSVLAQSPKDQKGCAIFSLVRLERPHLAKARSSPETFDAFNPLISDICLARCVLNEITASLDVASQQAEKFQCSADLSVAGRDSD